jgi:hypothetical protein
MLRAQVPQNCSHSSYSVGCSTHDCRCKINKILLLEDWRSEMDQAVPRNSSILTPKGQLRETPPICREFELKYVIYIWSFCPTATTAGTRRRLLRVTGLQLQSHEWISSLRPVCLTISLHPCPATGFVATFLCSNPCTTARQRNWPWTEHTAIMVNGRYVNWAIPMWEVICSCYSRMSVGHSCLHLEMSSLMRSFRTPP